MRGIVAGEGWNRCRIDSLSNTKKQSAATDAEGLKEGIGCMPMDEDEANVGSFRWKRSERGFIRLTS